MTTETKDQQYYANIIDKVLFSDDGYVARRNEHIMRKAEQREEAYLKRKKEQRILRIIAIAVVVILIVGLKFCVFSNTNDDKKAAVETAVQKTERIKSELLGKLEISVDFTYAKEKLDTKKISDLINLSEDKKSYTPDKEKIEAYVAGLAKKYDTFGKEREFNSTKRGQIKIPEGDGCYGWLMDTEKTSDELYSAVENKTSIVKPVYQIDSYTKYEYSCNPQWCSEKTDFSDTYIEVDLTAQHLWYYKSGKCEVDCSIVSGYVDSEERKTPAGVYKLWYKEPDKTLVGKTDGVAYESFVKYWNYVSTIGIGLHDASWQYENFDSTKCHNSEYGSSGCINMPTEQAKYIFENAEMGTPVFMYY